MMSRQIRQIEKAIFPDTTEGQVAEWRRAKGEKVRETSTGYWVETAHGFYQSLHWMSRLPIEAAVRPTPACWGYRTTLEDRSAGEANAFMPVHSLPKLGDYDMHALSSRQRNKLRNCLKKVEILQLTGPDLLLEEGYPVCCSAVERTGYGTLVSQQRYRKNVQDFFLPEFTLVVAGLIEDQLAGYVTAYSVGPTVYIENVFIQTEALKTNISLGLFYAVAQAARRSPQIVELVHGLHTPENPSLCSHKERLGFKVVQIPSKVWFLPPLGSLLCRVKPHTYYRLTGRYTDSDAGQFQRGMASSGPQELKQ